MLSNIPYNGRPGEDRETSGRAASFIDPPALLWSFKTASFITPLEVNGCLKWLFDQSADCPEAEARHGQTGIGWLIEPKPATVRLELVA
ncbi:hypothetical protein N7491_006080 [Penicillium cf. griseofulvum]|nr:hypothetical protein N7491_006080 [Penicillium cf. griseofulvum]